jgi:D-alanyl-D-alanine carboxypeptidase/D-alanyl-D-alanine-endopeptidase (penicillin-binding protein 4)
LRVRGYLPVVPLAVLLALGTATAGAAPAAAAGTTVAQEAASFARILSASSAPLSARVVADSGAVLADVRATTSLPPASTQKIATVGTALSVLGPAYRFTTLVQGTVPLPRASVWKGMGSTIYPGSVVVVAGGDPSLRTAGVAGLLSPVVASGVRTIRGGLWLDVSLFDRVRTAPGWKPQWVGPEVGPLSAFMLEKNQSRSDAAYLRDPDTGNLQILQSWLAGRGVTVLGGLHVGRPPVPARVPLGTWRSEPLSTLAQVTLRESVNTWAEMLVKAVGAARGAGSTAHGLEVERATVESAGGSMGQVSDGSGLSQLDRMNAVEEVSIVRGLGGTAIGPQLLADLPVSCTNGTLKRRLCTATGRVHAKTGTLDTVGALTGYVVDRAGNRLWFSVQVGGTLSGSSRAALIDRAVLALVGS